MRYQDACQRMREIYGSLVDGQVYTGEGYSNPVIRTAIHEFFPRRLLLTEGDSWTFHNTVTHIGPFLKEPTNKEALILFPHVIGDYYKEALDSMRPYHHKMLVVDQTKDHIIPEGDYALIRPTMRLSLFQLQNWAMMYCRKYGIKYQGYCHSDMVAHKPDVWDRMEQVAENTDSSVVFSCYDTLALYNLDVLKRVGFFDEQFQFYYGDVDWFNRMKYHDMRFCELKNHGVEHKGSQTIAVSSPEEQKVWHEGVADSMRKYVAKWGGSGHVPYRDETFVRPYGAL